MNKKNILSLNALLLVTVMAAAQSKSDIEQLAARTPPKTKTFSITHCISLPTPTKGEWDNDYNRFQKYVSPAIGKTQAGLSYTYNGVTTWTCIPSAMPHAQLDTATMITNERTLLGIWRAVTHRSIRFVDSASQQENSIYRSDTLLNDMSKDDVFAVFADRHFKLIVKEEGSKKYKNFVSAQYQVENGRYLMLYKLFKSASGISQIGIDKDGHLIINYAAVIENKKMNNYITYIAVINQFIFERIEGPAGSE